MADLKELYEKSQTTQTINQMEFTEGESANFKKAFDDPEFRKMFTEYMDEIQDPSNRQVRKHPGTRQSCYRGLNTLTAYLCMGITTS